MNRIDYSVKRSRRKTIAIYITGTGAVEVRAPRLVPKPAIELFVRSKTGWIQKQLAKINGQRPTVRTYTDGDRFLYLGKEILLKTGAFPAIGITGNRLTYPAAILFRIRTELPGWYRGEAERVITGRVRHYEEVVKTRVSGIRFSDTLSKWGSCTIDNRLQFNWRLVMAPILVIDYVVVHELVHTRIKNHSRAFWTEVAGYKPAHRQYRKWLRSHAALLQNHF